MKPAKPVLRGDVYHLKRRVPRRYAAHLPEWLPYDRVGSAFAAVVIAAVLVFVVRFASRLRTAAGGAA